MIETKLQTVFRLLQQDAMLILFVVVGSSKRPVTYKEIAEKSCLPNHSIRHAMNRLLKEGLLQETPQDGTLLTYELGSMVTPQPDRKSATIFLGWCAVAFDFALAIQSLRISPKDQYAEIYERLGKSYEDEDDRNEHQRNHDPGSDTETF